MSGILDYIDWRGDVPFETSPFNEVDAIILCQLEYNKLNSLVPKEFTSKAPSLCEISNAFFVTPDVEQRKDVGSLINPDTVELLKSAGNSRRFGSLRVSGYREVLDFSKDEQFAAVTFSYKSKTQNWNAVIFRGTDDYLVGWKEDFNLSYKVIPAQIDSVEYLNSVAKNYSGGLYLAGHSKGGNLSIYAAVNGISSAKKRIIDIFNFDGPGFSEEFFSSKEYLEIETREHTFVPQNSLVGMLMYHADGYITVESTESTGIKQHDPFTWQVLGTHFVERPDITDQSKFIAKTIQEWVTELPVEQKQIFVETLFGILEGTDAKTNAELSANPLENMKKVLKVSTKIDSETKDLVIKTIHLFVKYGWQNIGTLKNKK